MHLVIVCYNFCSGDSISSVEVGVPDAGAEILWPSYYNVVVVELFSF